MKTVITTSGSFLTGGELADAVAAYGLALARARELDVVDIPFVTADGAPRRVQLRIGWRIDTAVTGDERWNGDLTEPETVIDLTHRRRRLSNGTADHDGDGHHGAWGPEGAVDRASPVPDGAWEHII